MDETVIYRLLDLPSCEDMPEGGAGYYQEAYLNEETDGLRYPSFRRIFMKVNTGADITAAAVIGMTMSATECSTIGQLPKRQV